MKRTENTPLWEDIIFENRNKNYGAYELRIRYNARLSRSLVVTLSGIIFLFLCTIFLNSKKDTEPLFVTSKDPVVVSKSFAFENSKPALPKELSHPSPKTGQSDPNAYVPVTDKTQEAKPSDTSYTASGDTAHAGDLDTTSSAGLPGGNPFAHADTVTEPYSQASVDKVPEFPGGMEKFYKFLVKNIRYTDEARSAGLSGKIYLSFIIGEDGLIRNVKVLRKIGFGLDEEVERVLHLSPAWSPGMVRNNPVNTQIMLPVSFSLVKY